MIGHLLGGAGAAEAIVTVKAIEDQIAPPTANFTEADPECDLDYVPNEARELAIDVARLEQLRLRRRERVGRVRARRRARRRRRPRPTSTASWSPGIAALTPAGTDPDALWKALRGRARRTTAEDGARVGRVDFDAVATTSTPKERKRVDRLGLFSIITREARARGRRARDRRTTTATRVGAILGTGVGPMESMEAVSPPV